ncbi:extracellular solute-binding protein [Cohnella hashimotonis]|uniref:Extracellular solute-binding protein n=1 Tax=Cohnella hashimotonis TaxID=2826895 RepID=A0ABT6TB19_9BACL|nr:extracellular solute-binding protein [Cohnella hashimotonis]MDI4644031.1 extracellular solute-binding protein [Cohnella hashimotonis]
MKRFGTMITLSSMLAISALLPACSNNAPSNEASKSSSASTGSSESSATATASNASSETAPTGLPAKFDPPVEMSYVSYQFATLKYDKGDDVNNNNWTRMLKDEYGIVAKNVWEVPYAQYPQKTDLMIASGDIPDFFLASPTQLKQLYEADMIEDLTDVYNKYAPELVRKVQDAAGEYPRKAATIDGKLMGIPFTGVLRESVNGLWVRMDWIKKLGLPEPKTLEDFLTIADAFANKDPDGNNKKDTIGLGLDKDLAMTAPFMNMLHAYKSIWTKDADGKLVYSSTQPAMKEALVKLHDLYAKGILDKEFVVKDVTKLFEDVTANKVGMFYSAGTAGAYPLQGSKDNDPNVEWKMFPLPAYDDEPGKFQTELDIFHGFWVVKKGFKHPEALLRIQEQWLANFYFNNSDETHQKFVSNADNDTIWMESPAKLYMPTRNRDFYLLVNDVLSGKADKSTVPPGVRDILGMIEKYKAGDNQFWGQNLIYGEGGSMGVADHYINENLYVQNEFIAAPLQVMVDKGVNLTKLELDAFTKIITGNEPIESFDKFVTNWKKQGGDDVTKAINEWYTANQ